MDTDANMEGWGAVGDALESKFLKWGDGPFELQFQDEPLPQVRVNHWQGGRPSPCPGSESCPNCDQYRRSGDENYKPKKTVLFHCLWLDGDGEWQQRLFDMSLTAVKELKNARDRMGADIFSKAVIFCEKRGVGANTRYTFERVAGKKEALTGSTPARDDDIPF